MANVGLGDLAGDELRGKEIERAARRKRTIRGVIQKGEFITSGNNSANIASAKGLRCTSGIDSGPES